MVAALASGATRAKWVGVRIKSIITRLHTVGDLRFDKPHRFSSNCGYASVFMTERVSIAQVAELVDAPASGAGLRK